MLTNADERRPAGAAGAAGHQTGVRAGGGGGAKGAGRLIGVGKWGGSEFEPIDTSVSVEGCLVRSLRPHALVA
jgi:hypothetical protein